MKQTQKTERKKPGTKPDIAKDLEVLRLRMEKKSFRQIARETGQDVKTVHRRFKRVQESVG